MTAYSWGANSHGQLGLGIESELCSTPQPLSRLSFNINAVRAIRGGGGHVLVLDQYGRLHACGWNNRGQLGIDLSDDNQSHFTAIPSQFFKDCTIESFACGWDLSGAITSDGCLYVWGSNAFQQLGVCQRGFNAVRRPLALQLPRNEVPRQVTFGLRHCSVLTQDNHIYVLGRLRANDIHPALKMTQVAFNKMEDILRFQCDYKIDAIAGGQNHLLILAENRRRVLALGDNKFGQANCFEFEEDVKQLVAGWTHNGVLTKSNKIFLWGRNCYGQLGKAACDTIRTPVELNLPDGVVPKKLHLGSEHGLVCSTDGKVYTWGWNEHGNCGNGSSDNLFTPTLVPLKSACKVAGTGAGFCYALCEE
ncbi:secretion-regulating guanine nucleotide exchange factor [Eupeodes corollae]|uniref:secretion-regulating guanine nucleotide exchange factor n=1 Tax=Eupeodes corollae TaxID=290404 RepID=UPI002492D2FA|nr:secretion-regulating guanine nucleotide exchange factor [Eupeodes corollae]